MYFANQSNQHGTMASSPDRSAVVPTAPGSCATSSSATASPTPASPILPGTATAIGLLVLSQVPTVQDLFGIGLVIAGVVRHHAPTTEIAANQSGEPVSAGATQPSKDRP